MNAFRKMVLVPEDEYVSNNSATTVISHTPDEEHSLREREKLQKDMVTLLESQIPSSQKMLLYNQYLQKLLHKKFKDDKYSVKTTSKQDYMDADFFEKLLKAELPEVKNEDESRVRDIVNDAVKAKLEQKDIQVQAEPEVEDKSTEQSLDYEILKFVYPNIQLTDKGEIFISDEKGYIPTSKFSEIMKYLHNPVLSPFEDESSKSSRPPPGTKEVLKELARKGFQERFIPNYYARQILSGYKEGYEEMKKTKKTLGSQSGRGFKKSNTSTLKWETLGKF